MCFLVVACSPTVIGIMYDWSWQALNLWDNGYKYSYNGGDEKECYSSTPAISDAIIPKEELKYGSDHEHV